MPAPYKVVSYITAKNDEIFPEKLDLAGITHVNFGFAFLRDTDVFVRRPECLKILSRACREQGVKLLVSLQQWGGQRFDERCRTESDRRLVASQVLSIVEEFQLDGVDVDWEYPGYNLRLGQEIPDFEDHFYIDFMQALRDVLPNKLLTIAHGGEPRYYKHTDFKKLAKILDFINLMGYDYNWSSLGSSHHSNLFPASVGRSAEEALRARENAKEGDVLPAPLCDDEAVRYYLWEGVPAEKIHIGVPYYGYVADQGPEGFYTYDQILHLLETDPSYELCFDEKAQQSYVKKDGLFHIAFDDERTLRLKCDYIKTLGLGGLMNWTYNHDPKGQARNIVKEALLDSAEN